MCIDCRRFILPRRPGKDLFADVYSDTVSEALRRLDTEGLSPDELTERRNAILFAARDDKLKRQRAARELPDRFGLGFINREDYSRVKGILRALVAGEPIGEHDLGWLGTAGRKYWTNQMRETHHRIVAERLTEDWRLTGDVRTAINASGNWRKARAPQDALQVTESALTRTSPHKLRAALCTTRGGALRDLGRSDEAIASGMEAHLLAPSDFRPCTLLGAVRIETGAFAEGAAWYGMV